MKTKPIPAVITLIAAFITCLVAFLTHMEMSAFAKVFLMVVVGFYIMGCIIKLILDKNFKAPEEEESKEQTEQEDTQEEVVEKEIPEAETDKMNEK